MESKELRGIYSAYTKVYENLLVDDIVEFCLDEEVFDSIDETYYFAEELIAENLVETFIEDLLEFYGIEELLVEGKAQLIAKGLQAAGGLLKKLPAAARGLSTKTALKKGFRPTALSSKGKALSGAAKSDDIARVQAARAARNAPVETEKSGKYLKMLQAKKASQPSTPSPSASPAKPNAVSSGWKRHDDAIQRVQHAAIVAKGFLKSLEPSASTAAKTATKASRMPKGAAADPWMQFPKKRPKQYGIPKPEVKIPSAKVLPPAGKVGAPALPPAKTKTSNVPSSTTKGGGLTQTVRATLSPTEKTGNMKYPGLEKYATTGKEPPIKKSKGSKLGPIAAGAGLVGAGIVGSREPKDEKTKPVKTNVYNTKDPDGRIRSRAKVGPAKIGTTFEDAFRFYRKRGDKTFKYAGKEYTTKMAEELITDYLLSEGFVSDEKAAENLIDVMSSSWIQQIIESD